MTLPPTRPAFWLPLIALIFGVGLVLAHTHQQARFQLVPVASAAQLEMTTTRTLAQANGGSGATQAGTTPPCHMVFMTITGPEYDAYQHQRNLHDPQSCITIPFDLYLGVLLTTLVPYILFVALIMIVFSGVQYMGSALSGDATKAAKQRIGSVLIGVIFFFLIRLILNQISSGINL